jgi:hypothetical protein
MCERLKQSVLKTDVRETVPGVRIPLPPPVCAAGSFRFRLRCACRDAIPLGRFLDHPWYALSRYRTERCERTIIMFN